MRCINCGWNNPDNVDRCQKCNQPMPVLPSVAEKFEKHKDSQQDARATIREEQTPAPQPVVAPVVVPVPEPVPEPEPVPVEPEPVPAAPAPQPAPAAEAPLKLVSLEAGDPIVCESLPYMVNRGSSAALGAAADAVSQAELTLEADGLYIEDKSVYKNTYVLASRKIRLEKGDVVVLGGHRFVVE